MKPHNPSAHWPLTSGLGGFSLSLYKSCLGEDTISGCTSRCSWCYDAAAGVLYLSISSSLVSLLLFIRILVATSCKTSPYEARNSDYIWRGHWRDSSGTLLSAQTHSTVPISQRHFYKEISPGESLKIARSNLWNYQNEMNIQATCQGSRLDTGI